MDFDCPSLYATIKSMWKEDCKNFQSVKNKTCDDLASKALETPYIHSKYLNFYYDIKQTYEQVTKDLLILKREKRQFYKGQSTGKVNIEKGWNLKIKGEAELQSYIESDEEYSSLLLTQKSLANLIEYVKNILAQLNTRSYLINSTIEWIKFSNGLS